MRLSKSFLQNRNFLFISAGVIILFNMGCWCFGALFVMNFWIKQPIDDPLMLPPLDPAAEDFFLPEDATLEENETSQESGVEDNNSSVPAAGEKNEWIFLAIAIDYRGENYVYGLADVIRLVRVDFDHAQINVVSLPRNLLVNVPTNRIQAENPILLNQAYFFGSEGMQKYSGSGYGAGALAETIQANFGITVDHYVVINFGGFIQIIDALGGIEVNLPKEIKAEKEVLFPAGVQTLTGEEALKLARTRTNYSDMERMDHQNLILQAIFRKLTDPSVIYQLPELVNTLKGSVLTDVSPEQILTLINLLPRLREEKIGYASPSADLMTPDKQYIPSVRYEMQILRWDARLINWIHESLWEDVK
ncbi:MAG: LCP family protein [Anaerolineae bacterium]|jgi:LCP family protein required for cell wall assembly|nr:LCP family protein [Anaerolineae bacterium]